MKKNFYFVKKMNLGDTYKLKAEKIKSTFYIFSDSKKLDLFEAYLLSANNYKFLGDYVKASECYMEAYLYSDEFEKIISLLKRQNVMKNLILI